MRVASEMDANDDDDDDDLANKVSNPGCRKEEHNRKAVDKQERSGGPSDADSQTSSSVHNLIISISRESQVLQKQM